jgi:hypothetical protein
MGTEIRSRLDESGRGRPGPIRRRARAALSEAELLHPDETGLRRAWATALAAHRDHCLVHRPVLHIKRGRDGIDAAGVVSGFTGIVVHDAFAPYARYPAATHGRRATPICCASWPRWSTTITPHAAAARSAVPAGWMLMRLVDELRCTASAVSTSGRR